MTTPYSHDLPRAKPEHHRSPDSMSAHSDSPLTSPQPPASYPPLPSQPSSSIGRGSRHVRLQQSNDNLSHAMRNYDSERAATMPMPGQQSGLHPGSRNGSWDVLAGIRKFEHSYEEFDSSNASQSHLAFAEGDIPNNRVRVYQKFEVCLCCPGMTMQLLVVVPGDNFVFSGESNIDLFC